MKEYTIGISLLTFLFAGSAGFTQPTTKGFSGNGQVDTRVDNMRYWMKKAEQGIIPFNPQITIAPALYNGSQINAPGVTTTDSQDVPVTNLTNVTESENSVFVDPNNADYILNSNNSTSWSGGSVGVLYGADYLQSTDGGTTWGGSVQGAGGSNSGDPTTAINLSGRQYVNYIDDPGGQGVAYSDDGISWSTATIAPNPGSLADKNHMWIDNKVGSPYVGNLYAAWTDFGGSDDTEIKISRSTTNGTSWSTPLNISSAINAGSHNQGVNIQTGPNGEVYVAWSVYDGWPTDESAIGFAKSTNGGVSYQAATRIISSIKGIRNTTAGKNHRVNSFPVMAVDISNGTYSGNIYIVWTNVGVPGTNSGTNKSVYIIRSSDGGATWSTPVRVNQGAFTDGKAAYFPWISCDPETGVLSVVFYDDRNVGTSQCEVYSAYSTDAGSTWTDFKVSDVSFTPSAIPGLAGGYMGDYLGITSKGGKVYPCWTDNRGGIYMTYVSPYQLGLNASFTASSTLICTGSSVTFTSNSTGPPTSWTWSFPGGTPSSFVGQTPPAVTYAVPGTYDVSLTVSDGTNTDTETKTAFITVKNVIADFSGTPTTVVIGNTVTFTDNSLCSPDTWNWSFPGGTPSSFSGQNPPAITYNAVGSYDVILTVTKAGSTDTKTQSSYITVTPPVFNMGNSTITTCTGDFYDSGGSSGNYQNNENYTMTFLPSAPGNMIQMVFTTFSTESGYDYLRIYDGSNTSAPLIGTYNGSVGPGTVTATNPDGALTFNFTSDGSVISSGWSASISCQNPNLNANFSAGNTTVCKGSAVTFTNLSVGSITSWNWSFPGGTPSSYPGQNPPAIYYNTAGTYDVSLTVSDGTNTDTETKTGYMTVNPMSADFTGTPTSVVVGNAVTFTDNSTCGPATWDWSFPGGTPSTYNGQSPPPITYSTLGTYDVTLVVTKPGESYTKVKTGYITVTPPVYNMTNGTVTACTGDFYDSGGSGGSYQDYETYTMTFYPLTSGSMLRFSFNSFVTESGYDYLRIYNGTSTADPLIGVYHGSAGPGVITASNADGALTFNFTSDGSVVYSGWSAAISCESTTNPPVADFMASNVNPPINSTVTLTDLSVHIPTSWNWIITPASFVYAGGTNANSQNPHVQFTSIGSYTVSLTASNANGSDTETKTNYINTTSCAPCASTSNNASDEWISNVIFNTIDNNSGGSVGYEDFTAVSTVVTPGSAYSLSITCTQVDGWSEHAWAFIDWNHDCDFTDAGESYDVGEVTGSGTMTIDAMVPSDATPGPNRFRASLKYYYDPTSCETFSFGQVEDYTVIVEGSTKNLTLKAFLEGIYDGGGIMRQSYDELGPHFGSGIADQVTVELHNASEYSVIEYSSGPVNVATDGTISVTGIPDTHSGSYYLTVRHRNSLETTSANPVSLLGTSSTYDFTTSSSQAYGDNMKNVGGTFAIWGGDVNQDGIVDSSDMNPVDNLATIVTFGYLPEDANGDGIIDAGDMNIVDNNATAVIIAQTP